MTYAIVRMAAMFESESSGEFSSGLCNESGVTFFFNHRKFSQIVSRIYSSTIPHYLAIPNPSSSDHPPHVGVAFDRQFSPLAHEPLPFFVGLWASSSARTFGLQIEDWAKGSSRGFHP